MLDDVAYLGTTISAVGISPAGKLLGTAGKVQAIKDAAPPTSISELQSFLGSANFLPKFVPDFAMIASPLYSLLRKETPRKWATPEQDAFDNIKAALCSDSVLRHYNPTVELVLQCDAYSVGVGAALLQPAPDVTLQPYILTALRPYSITVLQLYSLTSLQSHGLTALDPYGLTSFRPYGLTSLRPATNGLAERYVGELKDKLEKIGDTGEPVQTKLDRLLLTYRATPTALEKSPSELLMNRQTRIIFSALRGKTSEQEELRFLKITLTTSLSLHRPNQFLCVILANEPNGFQEQLWKF